jgi:hypothetical protein
MTEIMFHSDAMMLTPTEFRVLLRKFSSENGPGSNTTDNDFYNGCLNLLHRFDAYMSACERYKDSQIDKYINDELDDLNDPGSTVHNVVPQWEEPPL